MLNLILNCLDVLFPYFAVIAFLFFANSVVNKILISRRGVKL